MVGLCTSIMLLIVINDLRNRYKDEVASERAWANSGFMVVKKDYGWEITNPHGGYEEISGDKLCLTKDAHPGIVRPENTDHVSIDNCVPPAPVNQP